MRKFFLLLCEWHNAQRMHDIRFYKIMCTQLKDPPEPGVLFPSLKPGSVTPGTSGDDDDDIDDELAFRRVAAAFTPRK